MRLPWRFSWLTPVILWKQTGRISQILEAKGCKESQIHLGGAAYLGISKKTPRALSGLLGVLLPEEVLPPNLSPSLSNSLLGGAAVPPITSAALTSHHITGKFLPSFYFNYFFKQLCWEGEQMLNGRLGIIRVRSLSVLCLQISTVLPLCSGAFLIKQDEASTINMSCFG